MATKSDDSKAKRIAGAKAKHRFEPEIEMMQRESLAPHPLNFRTHSDQQRQVWRSLRDSVGWAGTIIAYRSKKLNKGKLTILDGHLREEEARPDEELPVLVLDVSDDEANLILATHDQLGSMAVIGDIELRELLQDLTVDDPSIKQMLDDLALSVDLPEIDSPEDFTEYDANEESDYKCPKCAYEWNGQAR